MQELAWYISLILVVALLAIFVAVLLRSGRGADDASIQSRAYRFRGPAFWVLIFLGVLIAIITLQDLPYAAQPDPPGARQVVEATGHQWYWTLSREELVAGQPVEFRVTSADVNHGFGIYDDSLRLLAQTQAMPGYVNRLIYTFTEPGTYKILCLEYCGLAHHEMPAEIKVLAR
jgi:cytochrome c oxidase subunit 2